MTQSNTVTISTATERLQAVLNGENINQSLISLWKHFPLEDRTHDAFVERTISFQEELDLDLIKLSYNGLYGVEDWGTAIKWPTDPQVVGQVTDHPIKTVKDWNNLSTLLVDSGALKRELDYTKAIVAKYKGKVPIIATIFSPLTIAWKLCGVELLEHLKVNSDDLHRGLAIIANTTTNFAKELINIGVDGFFFASQVADYDKTTWKSYECFGKRYDLIILDEIKNDTWFNILHIHGLSPMFDRLKDYPVQAINWHDRTSNISLKDARALTDKILIGGIEENNVLKNGTEEELTAHFQDALAQVGDNKIIFAPGCVIPLSIPEEKLKLARNLIAKLEVEENS
ncbi:uroporphyrinogen decarboxylase family protein [Sporosarcina sp. NPDC096371]|uniref:uroporphyrinogen decarboxylase family protein n=1 Tax=Sporosarcina sp. NPDC096371 TaxID=3364530 RepID=UPI00382DA670